MRLLQTTSFAEAHDLASARPALHAALSTIRGPREPIVNWDAGTQSEADSPFVVGHQHIGRADRHGGPPANLRMPIALGWVTDPTVNEGVANRAVFGAA